VKKWIDLDTDESDRPRIEDNSYVRVWGKLKQFNNKKHVGAHFVRPITDFNEISYHFLEATVVHLHFTRGPPASGKAAINGSGGQQAQNGSGTESGIFPAGMSSIARKMYNCLKTTPQSNEGLHQQDIASRLHMETADVQKGGDELLEAGLVYTTVDEQTLAILDNGGF
jgi:replication factor A2